MINWPLQSRAEAFYGNPCDRNGEPSRRWEEQNLVSIAPPFAMYFAGRAVRSIRIHRKCADSLTRILAAIWKASGEDQSVLDRWGVSTFSGTHNFRLKRNAATLSMHAFGCAIDLAADRFPMGQKKRLMCAQVRKAFADEGWVNLKHDPMHFQAARL